MRLAVCTVGRISLSKTALLLTARFWKSSLRHPAVPPWQIRKEKAQRTFPLCLFFSANILREETLSIILKRVVAGFACSDFEHILNIVNEDLSVADIAGVERVLRCAYNIINRHLADNDFDLDFR